MSDKIKRLFPLSFKKPLWYLFKSPQREKNLLYSWLTELHGAGSFALHRFAHGKKRPLSICTGIKNRSDNYFQYVLSSLLQMDDREKIELCIYDCGSTDVPDFEAQLRKMWPGPLKFVSEERPFTRSYSFNKAIDMASHELIFACDADMSLPKDLVSLCNRYVSRRTVWFPICFNLNQNAPPTHKPGSGEWFPVGKGMFASYKWQFERIGGFDEKYVKWGGEDWDLWHRFWENGFLPLRTRTIGLFHHWHPSLKPKGFKWEK